MPDFPIGSNFAVAFWFRPTPGSLDGQGSYPYMFSWGGTPDANNTINVWFTGAGAGHRPGLAHERPGF